MRHAGKLWLGLITLLACTYDAGRLQAPEKKISAANDSSGNGGSLAEAASVGGGSRAGKISGGGGSLVGGRADLGGSGSTAETRGGASGAGGAAGGQASASQVTDEVSFVNARAHGAMSGYGRISLGIRGSIVSPTCLGLPISAVPLQAPAVTFNSSCDPEDIVWEPSDGLCVTATIPAWPSGADGSVYDQDWGVLVGVSAREQGDAIGTAYRTVIFTVTGMPFAELRAVLHLKSDPDNTTYCARIFSQTPLKLSNFNTQCWDGSGQNLLPADTVKIDLVGVVVAAGSWSIPLKNFCLAKIAFGR